MKTRDTVIDLTAAEWSDRPDFARSSGRTASQRKGLRYERKIEEDLKELYGDSLKCGPWIKFTDRRGTGYAQPDFIVDLPDRVLIIECKLTYKPKAKDKLRRVYARLIRMLNSKPRLCVQVCRGFGGWLDPGTELTTLETLASIPFKDRDYLVVHQW